MEKSKVHFILLLTVIVVILRMTMLKYILGNKVSFHIAMHGVTVSMHNCFPGKCLSPMLECLFKCRLGLELSLVSGCNMTFLKLVIDGFFFSGTPVSSPPYQLMVSANRLKLKLNEISTL